MEILDLNAPILPWWHDLRVHERFGLSVDNFGTRTLLIDPLPQPWMSIEEGLFLISTGVLHFVSLDNAHCKGGGGDFWWLKWLRIGSSVVPGMGTIKSSFSFVEATTARIELPPILKVAQSIRWQWMYRRSCLMKFGWIGTSRSWLVSRTTKLNCLRNEKCPTTGSKNLPEVE